MCHERGQALVEFALVLPVFLVLILGLIDFGNAYNDHNDMTHLAGVAVRYAAVDNCGSCSGTIEDYVRAIADNDCLSGTGSCGVTGPEAPISICFWFPDHPTDNEPHIGHPVQAVVETNYRWLPFLDLGSSVRLRATATMRIEQAFVPPVHYTPDDNDCGT